MVCNRDQALRDEFFTVEAFPFLPPLDAYTRLFYRLPVLDITKRRCSRSPLGRRNLRQAYTGWGVPTACGDDATRSVVSIIGPGPYEIPSNSTADLFMNSADNDTITCAVTWRDAPPGIVQVTTSIMVVEGPVYDSDDFFVIGNATWKAATFDFNQSASASISLRGALQNTTRSTRGIGCRVVGIDPATTLPVVAQAMTNKIVFRVGDFWQNFTFPIVTTYPTRSPSNAPLVPTQQPTRGPSSTGPTFTPTVQPSVNSPTQAPTPLCDGYSISHAGSCGNISSLAICCSDPFHCCSGAGFCGNGTVYCGGGCQPRYGRCDSP